MKFVVLTRTIVFCHQTAICVLLCTTSFSIQVCFTHIHQGSWPGTILPLHQWAIAPLSQCHWSNPEEYGKYIIGIHNKLLIHPKNILCIFMGYAASRRIWVVFCSHAGMDYWNPLWGNQCYHRVAGCTLGLQAMMKEIKMLWRRCVGYGDRTGIVLQPRYVDHKGFGSWSWLKELGSSTSMNIIRFALAMFVCLVLYWLCFYQTRSAWSMDQGSTKKRSAVHNFVPTVTKFCVMWEENVFYLILDPWIRLISFDKSRAWLIFAISFRVSSLQLGQSNDHPSQSFVHVMSQPMYPDEIGKFHYVYIPCLSGCAASMIFSPDT